jgi:hypothetical protein
MAALPTPSRAPASRMGTGIGRSNRPEKIMARCGISVRQIQISGTCREVALALNSQQQLLFSCGIKSQYEI